MASSRVFMRYPFDAATAVTTTDASGSKDPTSERSAVRVENMSSK
jgi:hypothetical protein